MKYLLEVFQLSVHIGQKPLLDNVSFKVPQGKITAIVGASGSGKTTIANAILGLLPNPLRVSNGQILFDLKDLLSLPQEQLRFIRGGHMSMTFQEPLWAFNPLMRIGQQIDEVLAAHTFLNKISRYQRVQEVLSKVQLSCPEEIAQRYPHQLSGGQRQRAMIAQALVMNPKLVIADEPTSNLDVILQAKIMDLFRQFKKEGMTVLLISHDLGMVSHLADEVIILKDGRVVEAGPTEAIMKKPKHPYTRTLIEAFI